MHFKIAIQVWNDFEMCNLIFSSNNFSLQFGNGFIFL